VPRKIVSRATLGTRAIGSPALVYWVASAGHYPYSWRCGGI